MTDISIGLFSWNRAKRRWRPWSRDAAESELECIGTSPPEKLSNAHFYQRAFRKSRWMTGDGTGEDKDH
jgi:hypothetical protein